MLGGGCSCNSGFVLQPDVAMSAKRQIVVRIESFPCNNRLLHKENLTHQLLRKPPWLNPPPQFTIPNESLVMFKENRDLEAPELLEVFRGFIDLPSLAFWNLGMFFTAFCSVSLFSAHVSFLLQHFLRVQQSRVGGRGENVEFLEVLEILSAKRPPCSIADCGFSREGTSLFCAGVSFVLPKTLKTLTSSNKEVKTP